VSNRFSYPITLLKKLLYLPVFLLPQRNLVNADILLISSDNARYFLRNNKYISPVLQSLRLSQPLKSFTFEHLARPYALKFGDRCTDNAVQFNIIFIISRVCDKFCTLLGINSHFEVLVYKRLLTKVSPRVVIGFELSSSLCVAANKLSIKTIEILHGLGHESVPPYFYGRDIIHLPAMIIAFDPVSYSTFRGFGFDVLLADLITSNKFIEYQQNKVSNRIIVSLQWGYCGDFSDEENGMKIQINGFFTNELKKAVEQSCDSYQWCFRLHPVLEQRNGYNEILSHFEKWVIGIRNAYIESSESQHIISSMHQSSAHITMNSSSCYEAALVGVPSLILCPSVHEGGNRSERFDDLVKNNCALKASLNAREILEWLSNASDIKCSFKAKNSKSCANIVRDVIA